MWSSFERSKIHWLAANIALFIEMLIFGITSSQSYRVFGQSIELCNGGSCCVTCCLQAEGLALLEGAFKTLACQSACQLNLNTTGCNILFSDALDVDSCKLGVSFGTSSELTFFFNSVSPNITATLCCAAAGDVLVDDDAVHQCVATSSPTFTPSSSPTISLTMNANSNEENLAVRTLSAAALSGVIIASVGALLLLISLMIFFRRKRIQKKTSTQILEPTFKLFSQKENGFFGGMSKTAKANVKDKNFPKLPDPKEVEAFSINYYQQNPMIIENRMKNRLTNEPIGAKVQAKPVKLQKFPSKNDNKNKLRFSDVTDWPDVYALEESQKARNKKLPRQFKHSL